MNKVVHRFIRSANIDSNVYNRVANRFDPFKNTQITLEDPANNRTLTLIGTTNSSTTLAHRTRLLLDKIKPDAVYVQTSPTWWKYAQHVNVYRSSFRLKLSHFSLKPVETSPKLHTNMKTIQEDSCLEQDMASGSTALKVLCVTTTTFRVPRRLRFLQTRTLNLLCPQVR